MTSRVCAYCGAGGTLTREHVIPGFIYERERGFSSWSQSSNISDRGTVKIVGAEVTVADVCATCNNGWLSELDKYGAALYDRYFTKIVQPGQLVRLEYQFAPLSRWLLKIAYNTCRSHNWRRHFRDLLAEHKSFIRGLEPSPPYFRLYLQLIVPDEFSAAQKAQLLRDYGLTEKDGEPRIRRVAPLIAYTLRGGFLVGMNSYQFHCFFWETGTKSSQIEQYEKRILKTIMGAKRVNENSADLTTYPSSETLLSLSKDNPYLVRNIRLGAAWTAEQLAKKHKKA